MLDEVADALEAGTIPAPTPPTPPATSTPEADAETTAVESGEELRDRQRSILETMLEHEITSERRRKSRADIVHLINRTHNSSSYGRDFADLVGRAYLFSREGPGGGYWLTPMGKSEAQRLRTSN
jgi:hypothetical protein